MEILDSFKSFFKRNFELQYHYRGFFGKTPAEWTTRRYEAILTKSERTLAEKSFDPTIDGCIMDTIGRLFPEKILK